MVDFCFTAVAQYFLKRMSKPSLISYKHNPMHKCIQPMQEYQQDNKHSFPPVGIQEDMLQSFKKSIKTHSISIITLWMRSYYNTPAHVCDYSDV